MTNKVINGYVTLVPIWSILCSRNSENAVLELQILLDKIKLYSDHIFSELNITDESEREIVRAVILSLMQSAYLNEQDQIFDSIETFTNLILESVRSNIITAEFANDLAPCSVFTNTKMACHIHVLVNKNKLLKFDSEKHSQEIVHAICKINRKLIEQNPQLRPESLSIALSEASPAIFSSIIESKSLDWKYNNGGTRDCAAQFLVTCIKQFEITQQSIFSALVKSNIASNGEQL